MLTIDQDTENLVFLVIGFAAGLASSSEHPDKKWFLDTIERTRKKLIESSMKSHECDQAELMK